MKKIVSTIAFVLAASTAMAADAVSEVPAAPAAEVAPLFSWTGFTAGVQAGYGWNNNDASIVGLPGETSADFDGALAGGFVGFNYDLGNSWVVGLEADFEKNWGDDSATFSAQASTTGLTGRVRFAAGSDTHLTVHWYTVPQAGPMLAAMRKSRALPT